MHPPLAVEPASTGDGEAARRAFAQACLPWTGDFAWAQQLRAQRRTAGGPTISALVHTLNEERNLPDALRSIAWCDEIVVVDMHSDDRTQEIARDHGARVEPFERCGYVEPARNHAIATTTGDWILILDADERVSAPLAAALASIATGDEVDVLQLPRRNWLCGRWLGASGWGDDHQLRFFRRGTLPWQDRIHSQPEVHGRLAVLGREGGREILHFNYVDLEHFVGKLNLYTGHEPATGDWLEGAAQARQEIRLRWAPEADGSQSAALSVAMFFYRFLAAAKDWESRGWPEIGAPRTAAEALRGLMSDAPRLHRLALERFEEGDAAAAAELARHAIGESLDPGHAGAAENLAALDAR